MTILSPEQISTIVQSCTSNGTTTITTISVMNDADNLLPPFLLLLLLFPSDVVSFVLLYVCQFMVMMMAVVVRCSRGTKQR